MEYLKKSFSVGGYSREYGRNFDEAFGREPSENPEGLSAIECMVRDAPKLMHDVRYPSMEPTVHLLRVCRRCAHVIRPGESHGYSPLAGICITRVAGK